MQMKQLIVWLTGLKPLKNCPIAMTTYLEVIPTLLGSTDKQWHSSIDEAWLTSCDAQ